MKFVEASLIRDIGEDNRSVVEKAAPSDGTRMGILNGRVDAARGHAGGPRERDVLRLVGGGLRGLLAESLLRERANAAQGESEKKHDKEETWRRAGAHFVAVPDIGSSTCRIRSARMFFRVCRTPLGHRISSDSATDSEPRPKWMRLSLEAR